MSDELGPWRQPRLIYLLHLGKEFPVKDEDEDGTAPLEDTQEMDAVPGDEPEPLPRRPRPPYLVPIDGGREGGGRNPYFGPVQRAQNKEDRP